MTTLKIWTVVCAALLVATLVSGAAVAQDPKVQDPKVQGATSVEGILMAIDQNARVLTLKAGENEMQFSFTDQTELIAPQNGKPLELKQGTKMRVHYTEHEKARIATKIEII
jgi:hypothetical protein